MRYITLALSAAATLAYGCGWPDYSIIDARPYSDCSAYGADEWTWVVDNPTHCGACGNRCPAGVPCVGTSCRFDSVLHCGEANRRCIAADDKPRAVSCEPFDADDEQPAGVEVVGGYGCVSLEPPPRVRLGEGEPEVVETPKLDGVRWLTVPGHSTTCNEGLGVNGCTTADVEYFNACAEPSTERFAYDFAIMTNEMSRGQFRDLMCDCDAPKADQCMALCDERDAPDSGVLAALPMTGLNWCEAYSACKALGARLPTARERAVLEALVDTPSPLFDEPLSCGEWAGETGRVPWLAECLNRPLDELEFDDVKGAAGQVFATGGALTMPEPLTHLVGNVAEWLADPVRGLTRLASGADGPAWGLPMSIAEFKEPRWVRGRSLFSPAGQPGAQLIAVEPSVKAEDLGLRCALTIDSPFDVPMPYDPSLFADEHAECENEPVGLRPVRQSVGEQVAQAVAVCIDSDRDLPAGFRLVLLQRARELFVLPGYSGQLARRSVGGRIAEIGPARFAMDEQWWLTEPVGIPGKDVDLRPDGISLRLLWEGEEMPKTSMCMSMAGADPSTAEAYGQIVRRHPFILGRDYWAAFAVGEPATLCVHLDCVDDELPAEACAAECPGWRLPYVIEFRPVEPSSEALYCP